MQILALIVAGSFLLILIVGVPLCLIPRMRERVGMAFFLWSFLSGIYLFASSFQVVALLWGGLFAVAGLVLGIVPLVPMGILAALFAAQWKILFALLLNFVITMAAHYGGPLMGIDVSKSARK